MTAPESKLEKAERAMHELTGPEGERPLPEEQAKHVLRAIIQASPLLRGADIIAMRSPKMIIERI